jgi:hypothetical protein
MSQPSPETLEREADKLFVTDAELIRRLGVPRRTARAMLHVLDSNPRSGFPKKQKLCGDRRWWPAVRAYFDRMYGSTMTPQPTNQQGRRA